MCKRSDTHHFRYRPRAGMLIEVWRLRFIESEASASSSFPEKNGVLTFMFLALTARRSIGWSPLSHWSAATVFRGASFESRNRLSWST